MIKLKSLIIRESLGKDEITAWANFFHNSQFNTEEDARQYILAKMIHFNNQAPEHMRLDVETLKQDAVTIPLHKVGGKYKVGYKPKIERLGTSPTEASPDFPVNWNEPDIQMGTAWNKEVVRKFAGVSNKIPIYPSIIDLNELSPKLVEDDPEEADWSEYKHHSKGFPPIVVQRKKNGNLIVMDGNHRTYWAQQNNYNTIGAWVVDLMMPNVHS